MLRISNKIKQNFSFEEDYFDVSKEELEKAFQELAVCNVFIIADTGGERNPFISLISSIKSAIYNASSSADNEKLNLCYSFKHYPNVLYYGMTGQVKVDMKYIFRSIRRNDAVVIVIGDGGVDTDEWTEERNQDTIYFLKKIKKVSRQVVWLNPLPIQRWNGFLSRRIERYAPMFSLSNSCDIDGNEFPAVRQLEKSIEIIKGSKKRKWWQNIIPIIGE